MIPMTDIATPADLGRAIRTQRRALGFTQEQLAAAAGVNPRFVVELEGGKTTAQLGKALQVARAVGLLVQARAVS
ncbi:MAG: helix-turn-helix transcriptional regulator [Thermoleophilia bacterium]|nr:helix-turn-helix transcriptional regulator [Thermoleophilia bacterium]